MKLLFENWRKYLKETIGLDEMPDLSLDPEAFETAKSPIPLEIRFAEEDETIQTKEGSVDAKAGDAIMTGTEGEQWPIPREKFEQTYDVLESGLAAKKDIPVFAKEMLESFQVKVSWADDLLEGESGDYLVQYGEGDYGVVGRKIFEKTYKPKEEPGSEEGTLYLSRPKYDPLDRSVYGRIRRAKFRPAMPLRPWGKEAAKRGKKK